MNKVTTKCEDNKKSDGERPASSSMTNASTVVTVMDNNNLRMSLELLARNNRTVSNPNPYKDPQDMSISDLRLYHALIGQKRIRELDRSYEHGTLTNSNNQSSEKNKTDKVKIVKGQPQRDNAKHDDICPERASIISRMLKHAHRVVNSADSWSSLTGSLKRNWKNPAMTKMIAEVAVRNAGTINSKSGVELSGDFKRQLELIAQGVIVDQDEVMHTVFCKMTDEKAKKIAGSVPSEMKPKCILHGVFHNEKDGCKAEIVTSILYVAQFETSGTIITSNDNELNDSGIDESTNMRTCAWCEKEIPNITSDLLVIQPDAMAPCLMYMASEDEAIASTSVLAKMKRETNRPNK